MNVHDALATHSPGTLAGGPLAHQRYLLRRRFFNVLHNGFHLYDANGNLVLFMRQRGFRLKEDLRIFTGEDMREEVLRITARSIIDFGATYDVVDSATGESLGALRRNGFKSLLKDEWAILDPMGNEIGLVEEDNLALAIVRRWVWSLVPQSFNGSVRGSRAFVFTQRFNPFVLKLELDFSPDTQGLLDRRMGLACALLMSAIEGRQSE